MLSVSSIESSPTSSSLTSHSSSEGTESRIKGSSSSLSAFFLSNLSFSLLLYIMLTKDSNLDVVRRFLFLEHMASKLVQLQSKAAQASQFVAKHGTAYYKQLLEQNKQYIQDPPTLEKCNELSKKLFYTRLASIPGRAESFKKEVDYAKQLWKNRQDLKVEDVSIGALFGLEVFCWFCAGEIVGRGFTFTGYYV